MTQHGGASRKRSKGGRGPYIQKSGGRPHGDGGDKRAGNTPPPPEHQYPYPWVRLRSASAHPFIYQRMIGQVDPTARPGDVVAVYDKQDHLFGHGFYHDRSQIGLRMLSYEPTAVDEDFFRKRIEQAIAWRRQLLGDDPATDAYRLVHAEGDGLSGLIAERYGDWIAIEVFSLGIFKRLDLIKRVLSESLISSEPAFAQASLCQGLPRRSSKSEGGNPKFVIRADEHVERLEGFEIPTLASDAVPPTITIRENGLRFRVDLRAGHKTGFFCDQRDNRKRLAALCRGAGVLDVCCYTGGFGVYAKKLGQAEAVTGVDLDEDAIELARKNANLNEVRIQHVHADAFGYLRQMQTNGNAYDVVVLDPPKFVGNRDEFQEGSRKYVDLNTLGMSVVRPGGLLLTCSCSGLVSREDFLGMVKAAASRLRRSLQFVDQTGAAPDHPVMANCPESAYLKAVWARVM
ncbi:MAG TPA: class I SAM-dependent rRNA methyltransferase [Phycisphaerae bacterium]|nr:class I SAM-dependent rRNA methyltransferase [Phycisphaerae bacterium]HRR86270.1 class I SAM-dependent rRNA methyltransferase [Phycisphaerae bacterium]